jgi:hypothetical protein
MLRTLPTRRLDHCPSPDNLTAKLQDQTFTTDLELLVAEWPSGYRIETGEQTARAVLEAIETFDQNPTPG